MDRRVGVLLPSFNSTNQQLGLPHIRVAERAARPLTSTCRSAAIEPVDRRSEPRKVGCHVGRNDRNLDRVGIRSDDGPSGKRAVRDDRRTRCEQPRRGTHYGHAGVAVPVPRLLSDLHRAPHWQARAGGGEPVPLRDRIAADGAIHRRGPGRRCRRQPCRWCTARECLRTGVCGDVGRSHHRSWPADAMRWY